MAVPITVLGLMESIRDTLKLMVWPAALDADQGLIFGDHVRIAPEFPAGTPTSLLTAATGPVAILTLKGTRYAHEEMPTWDDTTVGIGILMPWHSDESGEAGMTADLGLLQCVRQVREQYAYGTSRIESAPGESHHAATSAAAILSEDSGREWLAQEVTLEILHADGDD